MDENSVIKLAAIGIGGYLLYSYFTNPTTATSAPPVGTTGGGAPPPTTTPTPPPTTTTAHFDPSTIPPPPASGAAMVQGLIATASGNSQTTYNTSQWNWFLQHLDSTQASMESDPTNGTPITASQYVSLRSQAGLPYTLSAAGSSKSGGSTSGSPNTDLAAALVAQAGNTSLNIDQWNWYVTTMFPGAQPMDPSQAGFPDRDQNGVNVGPDGIPVIMTAQRYVSYRKAANLPSTVQGSSLQGLRKPIQGRGGWGMSGFQRGGAYGGAY